MVPQHNKKSIAVAAGVLGLLLSASSCTAATLSLGSVGAQHVGDTFSIPLYVSTADGEVMNAAGATITFPTDKLLVESVGKTGIIDLWAQQPVYSNQNGTVSMQGIVYNPGFTGTLGRVVSITFKALAPGSAAIGITEPTVLANDGQATEILTGSSGTSVAIVNAPSYSAASSAGANSPAAGNLLAHITSQSHPDETAWYSATHVVFDWQNGASVSAVRLGYDQDALGTPTVSYVPAVSHKEIDLADGIWYFHVQEKGPEGWGAVATYRVQIDTVPPLPLKIVFPNGATSSASTIAVQFSTTDDLSGIDHYALSVDGKSPTIVTAAEGSGVYALQNSAAGAHTLTVTAYDKAGNVAQASASFGSTMAPEVPQESPVSAFFLSYLAIFLITIVAVLLLVAVHWYLWRHFVLLEETDPIRSGHGRVVVRREFARVQDVAASELADIDNAVSGQLVTENLERAMQHIQKQLDESERVIDKTIDNGITRNTDTDPRSDGNPAA